MICVGGQPGYIACAGMRERDLVALSVARGRAIRSRESFVGGAAPRVKGTVPAIV